jgi:protein-S-isoprenylcysteine O-methyltransferase Ste14
MIDLEQAREDQRAAKEMADRYGNRPKVEAHIAAILTAVALYVLLTLFAATLGHPPDASYVAVAAFSAAGAALAYFVTRYRERSWDQRYSMYLGDIEAERRSRGERSARISQKGA